MNRARNDAFILRLSIATILAAPMGSAAVFAAEPAASGGGGIEEVLVTARRREESLQEVPLSIAALGTEDLQERNVTDLRQINGTVPNVVIQTRQFGGNSGQFRMRGAPGVVVYQDGAVLQGGSLPQFTDIERVEILRGPQGTLFGRASLGGAIQLVTRKPYETFGAEVRTAFGTDERLDLTANINIPVTDTFYAKLTGSSLTRDGYVTSTRVDTDFGNQDDKLARVDLLWKPIESIEARVQYARSTSKNNGTPYVNLGTDAVCNNAQAPAYWFNADGVRLFNAPNSWCIYTTVDSNAAVAGVQPLVTEFQNYGLREEYKNTIAIEDTNNWEKIDDVRLDVSWALSDAMTFRALGSRRWGSEASSDDLDGTGYNIFVNDLNAFVGQFDTRTAELQFLYNGSRFSGTTGIYWEERPGFFNRRINWLNNELTAGINDYLRAQALAAYPNVFTNPASAPFLLGNTFAIAKTDFEQRAAFTEWTYAATDALRITLGVRYTEEENTRVGYTVGQAAASLPPICCVLPLPGEVYFQGTGTPATTPGLPFEVWTPRASVQYQWNPEIMTYFTYSIGKTSGGSQVNPPAQTGRPPYFPLGSNVKNYELGLRSDLFDRNLRFNTSIFYSDYKNAALSEEVNPGVPLAANADAEIKGLEIEGTWLVSDAFTVNYGFGWIDAKYTTKGTSFNLVPGQPFPNTPEYSYNVGANYDWQLDGGAGISLRGDYNWQDKMLSNVDRITATETPDYGLLSARLGYRPAEGNWDVALSGTNLTDLYYITGSFRQPQGGVTTGSPGRPREFALNFNVRFE